MPASSNFSPQRPWRQYRTIVAAALLLLPFSVLADTVVLKNGDRLTGTVNQLAGGKLTVTTSYAGAVTITWDDVSSVKLDKPLILPIETRNGKQVDIRKTEITGIERTSSGFVVATANGPQPVPAPQLSTLRTAAAETAYEASIRPSFLHGWTGAANISLAVTGGNSETTSTLIICRASSLSGNADSKPSAIRMALRGMPTSTAKIAASAVKQMARPKTAAM